MKVLTVLRPGVSRSDLDKQGSMHAAVSLGKTISSLGHQVDYVCDATIEGAKNHPSDTPDIKLSDYVKMSYRIYRENSYDVIHFHIYTFNTIVTEIYNNILPTDKVVITLHVSPAIGRSAYGYTEVLYKLCTMDNVKFVGVGDLAVRGILGGYFSKYLDKDDANIHIINNGVDVYNDLPFVSGENRNGKVVVIGRCEQSKNVYEALSLCLQYNLKVIYIGESPVKIRNSTVKEYVDKVQHLIKENPDFIEWYPYLENKELQRLLGESSVLLTLSTMECCCLSVLEASSLGTPVVYLDTMGISDIMVDGLTGILCTKDTMYRKSWGKRYPIIMENIQKALDLDRLKMSEYTRDVYNYVNCANKYLDLYKELQ